MFIFTLAFGIAAVSAIALTPLYAWRLQLGGSRGLGLTLVLVSVGLALAFATSPGPRDEMFLIAFVVMLVGALFLYGERPDDRPRPPDDEPPWWPQFEDDFRRYTRPPRHSLSRR